MAKLSTKNSESSEATADERIAHEVAAELGRRRMSQAALARELMRSEFYVSRRLRGEVPFSAAELTHVAQILEVPVTQFLAGAA